MWVSKWKITKRSHQGRGNFSLNQGNGIQLKADQGEQIAKVGEFSQSRILAKKGLYKGEHGNPKLRPSQENSSERPT